MYYFTQAQRNLIAQTADDPNPPGGNALANMYDLIYQMIQQPDALGNVADGNVIAWFGAAAQTNRGIGGASDFIRSYTQAQLEIRSGDALPDVSSTLQTASDEIAKAVRDDIINDSTTINGVDYFALPTAHEIGEKDAIKTLESLSGFSSSPGIWSGNPLYIGLGDGSFWQSTILETAGDTYDLLAAARSFWIAGFDSLANVGDLVSLWYGQGSAGRDAALAQVAASLAATNGFFEDAYGYFGEVGIGGLLGDQIVVGSEGSDFSLEEQLGLSWNTFIHGGAGNDLLVGSLGEDTLDGGADHDEASFYLVSEKMSEGLHAAIFSLDSEAQFSAEVTGTDLQSFVFNVEELELSRHDDVLEVVDLYYDTSSLKDVYAGDNGVLGDKIDLSSVTVQGAIVDLESNTLRLTDAQGQLEVHGFENVVGTSHADTITGDDQANGINGHLGADALFGGGGDDFLFFDAEDGGNVIGGAGRDVAVGVGPDGVSVDMVQQELECVIGGGGADTIIAGSSSDSLFVAGGDGDDTFLINCGGGNGPRILWGGAGVDTFNLYDEPGSWLLGIAVVTIAGLTQEMFASLTVADLGLDGINLSSIGAILINPDASDVINNIDANFISSINPVGSGLVFQVQDSGLLGGNHAIQSLWEDDVVDREEVYNFESGFSVTIRRTLGEFSAEVVIEEGASPSQAYVDEMVAEHLEYSQWWFAELDAMYPPRDCPMGNFFVVGGHFVGTELVSDGAFSVTGHDPGATAFDWLLAA